MLSEDALKLYNKIFTQQPYRDTVAHVVQPMIFRVLLLHNSAPMQGGDTEKQLEALHTSTLIELDKTLEILEEMFESN